MLVYLKAEGGGYLRCVILKFKNIMGKGSSSSSSSISSSNHPLISTASSLTHLNSDLLPTDLRLGLSISSATQHVGSSMSRYEEINYESNQSINQSMRHAIWVN